MSSETKENHISGSKLKNRMQEDMKTAMRAKDKLKVGTIRMAMAAFKQVEVDNREKPPITDKDVLQILSKMIKQRRESITQFTDADRPELADKESAEITILQDYMPTPFSHAELEKLIDAAVDTVGGSDMSAMGKIMGVLKPQVQGRADMSQVSKLVREKLA